MGDREYQHITSRRSEPKNVSLMPTSSTFMEAGGTADHRPDEYLESEGGWLSNMMDTLGNAADDAAAAAGLIDRNVSLDDLSEEQRAQIEAMDEGSLLHLTFENEEMSGVNAEAEHERMAQEEGVLSIHNADATMMEYLFQSGRFSDMIISGHGSDEGLFTTAANGDAELLSNEALAGMLQGTSLEEVLLASCNSGDGMNEALAGAGVANVSFDNQVTNGQAGGAIDEFLENRDLLDITNDHEVAAEMRENLTGSDAKFASLYEMTRGGSDYHAAQPQGGGGDAPGGAGSDGGVGPRFLGPRFV